jgi:hypothetical protein
VRISILPCAAAVCAVFARPPLQPVAFSSRPASLSHRLPPGREDPHHNVWRRRVTLPNVCRSSAGAPARTRAVLMHVKSRTSRIQYFHSYFSPTGIVMWPREKPWSSKSRIRAPERKRSWQQFGVLAGSRVQLAFGLMAPWKGRPRSRRPGHPSQKPPILCCRSPASSLGADRRSMGN